MYYVVSLIYSQCLAYYCCYACHTYRSFVKEAIWRWTVLFIKSFIYFIYKFFFAAVVSGERHQFSLVAVRAFYYFGGSCSLVVIEAGL